MAENEANAPRRGGVSVFERTGSSALASALASTSGRGVRSDEPEAKRGIILVAGEASEREPAGVSGFGRRPGSPDGRTERRRHYRTEIPRSWGIEVRLVLATGEVLSGEMADMSIGGAGILVPGIKHTPLHAGDPVDVRMRGPGFRCPLAIAAVVQRCVPGPSGFFYGIRYLEVLDPGVELPSTLREVFNRRRLFRVRPNPREPLPLLVTPTIDRQGRVGDPIWLEVTDISGGGLAFITDPQTNSALGPAYDLSLEVHLPEQEAGVRFLAHVRYRVRVRAGWRFGVEFDRRRTDTFMRQQRLVTVYVMRRQRELLKPPGAL